MNQDYEQGLSHIESGNFTTAVEHLRRAVQSHTDPVEAWSALGSAWLGLNERKQARIALQQALEINPQHSISHRTLARVDLSGPHYLVMLQRIHASLRPERYIEVGVFRGASLALAHPDTLAIGIDPEPQLDLSTLPEKHQVVCDTSDHYFASGQLADQCQGKAVNLAFIDGMHQFEYALRDLIALERHANAETILLVHDCYPLNALTAEREQKTGFWSGDIWKLVLCLQTFRPDLTLELLPCPPTGLCVIRNLNPASRVLSEQLETIYQRYIDMDFQVIETNRAAKLGLLTLEETESRPYLQEFR